MSGTEFAAGKVKQLQLSRLQSVNFQLVYSVASDLFWKDLLLPNSVASLQCLYAFSPSGYLQHGEQEEGAWGSDMVRQVENH